MSLRISEKLEELFVRPKDEYMPVPWWAWTGDLNREQMERQLRMMHEQGIREFFIFPIYGMEVPYMSDEYLDRIGIVLNWCKDLGMKVWIYDEYNWPSGTAAGLVAKRHPEAIASNLFLEIHEAGQENTVKKLKTDPSVVHVARVENNKIAVYKRIKDTTVNLTVKGSLWCEPYPGMLDLLSERAVAAFIKEAYEPIAKRFPEHLGSTIKGYFTDEPSIAPGSIAWTDELPEAFRQRFGYDIVERLQDLNFPFPTSQQTRMDYWSTVAQLYAKAFTGQLTGWCEDRNMLLTGHLVHEEDSHSVWYQGDSPTQLLCMHIPGCDLLGLDNSFDTLEGWYHFGSESLVKTPKDPASAARFRGRNRVMCEAYGVAPWSRTMADEKRMTDWLSALGVNLFNDNSLISSIAGFRKRAIAGKHFTQPWWESAKLSYDYIGRLSALSAETVLDTELLLMYPSTTWWSGVVRSEKASGELRDCEACFDKTADALLRKHWDFEFLYEQIIQEAEIKEGTLITGYGDFRGIILAGTAFFRPETAAKLEKFAASGGFIAVIGPEPQVVDGTGQRPIDLAGATRIQEWSDAAFSEDLDNLLKRKISRSWDVSGKKAEETISASRITQDGRRLIFTANMTPGPKELQISWQSVKQVEMWDAGTGCRWIPEQDNGKLVLTLPEGESLWVVESGRRDSGANSEPPAHFRLPDGTPDMLLDGEWQFAIDRPNLLKLRLRLLPDPEGTVSFDSSEINGSEGWVDVIDDYCEMELSPEKMPYYWLKAEFILDGQVDDLHLITDTGDTENVWLNGHDAGSSRQLTVWDDENRACDLFSSVEGPNTLIMKVRTSPFNADDVVIFPRIFVEPIVLRGSFLCDEQNQTLETLTDTIRTGDWRDQGFSHFTGTGIYSRVFTWSGKKSDLIISCDCGRDLVEVLVDGVSLGKRAWGLRRFRAAGVEAGEHKLEIRVTNNLGNLLRRTYGGGVVNPAPPAGLLSPVTIESVSKG